MKAKYNNSNSNLSNDILSKHLIVLFIFIFTIIDFLLRQIRFWEFSKTLTGLKVLVFEVLVVRWPSGRHSFMILKVFINNKKWERIN